MRQIHLCGLCIDFKVLFTVGLHTLKKKITINIRLLTIVKSV